MTGYDLIATLFFLPEGDWGDDPPVLDALDKLIHILVQLDLEGVVRKIVDAVKKLVDSDELPCDEKIPEYSIEEFYDHLAERNWTINGTQIQSRHDWEMALIAKFYKHDSTIDHIYYWAFCRVFSTFDGLRDADGKTGAESVASSYIDDFDEDDKCWRIAGKTYPFSERQAALDAYVADWKDEQEESRPP